MEREDLIDLGEASRETKGHIGPFADNELGKVQPGLSDD